MNEENCSNLNKTEHLCAFDQTRDALAADADFKEKASPATAGSFFRCRNNGLVERRKGKELNVIPAKAGIHGLALKHHNQLKLRQIFERHLDSRFRGNDDVG